MICFYVKQVSSGSRNGLKTLKYQDTEITAIDVAIEITVKILGGG